MGNFHGGPLGVRFTRKCWNKGLKPSELKENERQVNTLATTVSVPSRSETQPFTATYATKA